MNPMTPTGETPNTMNPFPLLARSDTTDKVNREPEQTILQTHDIRKSYRIGGETRSVLDGVNFSVRSHETVFLCGPSGSGKSTLLSILGCLLGPDSGRLTILGSSIESLNRREQESFRRSKIGFVFQRFQLIRGLNAQDNVAVPLTLNGYSLQESRDRAADILCQIGLAEHVRSSPITMSPGQCQRVAIARAVAASPAVVLADEPTAALDAKSGKEVMELFKELIVSVGAAAVIVTHDPRINQYADRICEIENGRLG